MCVYVDSKGNKYKGRERVCKLCGDTKIVRITNKSDTCQKCRARDRKSSIPNDIPVKIYIRNGAERKRRLKKEVCSRCGNERFTRADHECSSGLCNRCRAIKLGKKHGPINGAASYKTGISVYRKKALRFFKEKCIKCEASHHDRKIIIHHVDEDRNNNDISNLMPLCHSCHRSLHNTIKKGEHNGRKEQSSLRIREKRKNLPI